MVLRFAENLAPMLAALDDPRAAAAERAARLVASSAREMSALLTDMCLLGELDTGRCIIRAEHIAPIAVVEHSVRRVAPEPGPALVFETRVPRDLPLVVVDPTKMRSVFRAILKRAAEVSPAGAMVCIAARAVNAAEVEFRITDAGPPLTPLEQTQLFDRYWLASVGKRKGLGLELVIAKRIIECHFGRLWIESGDGGTTFHFTIPSS
jgi:signal transduction histidine kinase